MSLRFVEIRVQQRAVVLTNTDRAVHVEVTRRDGSTYRVWVERGAGSGVHERWRLTAPIYCA